MATQCTEPIEMEMDVELIALKDVLKGSMAEENDSKRK